MGADDFSFPAGYAGVDDEKPTKKVDGSFSSARRRPASSRTRVGQLAHHPDQLGRIERFRKIGIDPELLATAAIVFLRPCGDQHDTDVARLLVVAEPDGGHPTVQPRHHHIQGNHLWTNITHSIQTILTIYRRFHLKSLESQIDRDELANHLVIIDNEYASLCLGHGREISVSRRAVGRVPSRRRSPSGTGNL